MSNDQHPGPTEGVGDAVSSRVLDAYEQGFEADGLPAFCRRPRRRPRVHLLSAGLGVAVVELAVTVPSGGWPAWLNVAAALVSLGALVVVAWAASRSVRRLVGPSRWGRHVGLVAVLATPPLVNAGAHAWSGRASTLWAVNAVVLAVLVLDDRTGLSAVARWSLRRTATQLRRAGGQLVRTVPLLTAVLLATFVAAEPWEVAADMGVANIVAAVTLLGGVGLAFAVRRSLDDARSDAAGYDGPPLRLSERINLAFTVLFTQGFTVAVAAALFSLLLTAFNSLAVSASTVSSWAQREVPELWGVHLGPLQVSLTSAHLAVGALGAAFAALAFAVSLAGDDQYHSLGHDEEVAHLRGALVRRAEYLELVGGPS